MDYTIEDVRHELQLLRERVHQGELLDSLGSEIGRLLDELDFDAPTSVHQLSEGEVAALMLKVSAIQEKLNANETIVLSDQEVINLLNGLRQSDLEIRDHGVFLTVMQGLQQGMFSDDQIVLMTRYLLQNRVILSHIDTSESDGVFLRSFAVFTLALLFYANRRQALDLFGDDLRSTAVDQIATYIALERDTRGFVDQKGWAHAFTHIGNLLDELTMDPNLSRADKIFLETILIERMKRLDTPLMMGEIGRISAYLTAWVNTNDIYATYFLKQLKQWRQEMTRQLQQESEAGWHRYYNQTHLQASLLMQPKLPQAIHEYLDDARQFLI
ncbi:DUF2785 domain-containing protein [Weissella diestrammenae]|uniref:DUF2785 domain-containing protein n=1 Tax=Weissella diestrammenae TaxID=1162633 RepID=A0A7G9T3M9_9LACO|nr:DUF2785 domain-containing protein [Weissella diestrammenae]MCM0582684.1 DUF2785 domain-containing protein [Weissella diestrammenae]QNN74704.1 DUF2785 domain-containing protein [Weissella diestrammenae]